ITRVTGRRAAALPETGATGVWPKENAGSTKNSAAVFKGCIAPPSTRARVPTGEGWGQDEQRLSDRLAIDDAALRIIRHRRLGVWSRRCGFRVLRCLGPRMGPRSAGQAFLSKRLIHMRKTAPM